MMTSASSGGGIGGGIGGGSIGATTSGIGAGIGPTKISGTCTSTIGTKGPVSHTAAIGSVANTTSLRIAASLSEASSEVAPSPSPLIVDELQAAALKAAATTAARAMAGVRGIAVNATVGAALDSCDAAFFDPRGCFVLTPRRCHSKLRPRKGCARG